MNQVLTSLRGLPERLRSTWTRSAARPPTVAPASTMRDRIQALIARSDRPELEQATIRVLLAGVVLVVVAWHVSGVGDNVSEALREVLTVLIGYFVLSFLLVLRILAAGKSSVIRRVLGMVIDNAAITYYLLRTDEAGAILLGLYLFIIFGYGFRYGRAYLHACQLMALTGFVFVLTQGGYWSHHIPFAIGFGMTLLTIPFYVGVLVQRITAHMKNLQMELDQARASLKDKEAASESGMAGMKLGS